jgi:hypothetical protein
MLSPSCKEKAFIAFFSIIVIALTVLLSEGEKAQRRWDM